MPPTAGATTAPRRSDTVFNAPTACSLAWSTMDGVTASIAVMQVAPDSPFAATSAAVNGVDPIQAAFTASPANVVPLISQVTRTRSQRSTRSARTPPPR